MTAPAIVLVAVGDPDPSVGTALESIAAQLRALRPDLDVRLGLLDTGEPTVLDSMAAAAADGASEIALVPLDLVSAAEHSPVVARAQEVVQQANANVNVRIARPVGPATELLNVLDNRVREALHRSSAVEVDALVLAAPEGGDVRGASLLARRARQWATHHKLPVQLAVNDSSGRATAGAIASLRAQGRRHVAVGSLFLTQGPMYRAHEQAAVRAGALAVTDPVGADPRLVELILARYAFAAMELLDDAPPSAQ